MPNGEELTVPPQETTLTTNAPQETLTRTANAPQELDPAELQRQRAEEWRNISRQGAEYQKTFASETTVRMPQKSMQKEYAKYGREFFSAGKRSTHSRLVGSALRRKRINRETVEKAEKEMAGPRAEYAARRRAVFSRQRNRAYNPWVQSILAPLLTQEDAERGTLPEDPRELMMEKIKGFLDQKLELHMENDEKFAEQIGKINLFLENCRALSRIQKYLHKNLYETELRQRWEDNGDRDARDRFEVLVRFKKKMELADKVRDYCEKRKLLITNPYYQTHYNSELSYRFREDSSQEERFVTQLVRAAEVRKNEICEMTGQRVSTPIRELPPQLQPEQNARAIRQLHDGLRPQDGSEYYSVAKWRNTGNRDPRSEQVYREMSRDSVARERLFRDTYHITGSRIDFGEPFDRGAGGLYLDIPAFAQMASVNLKDMLNDLKNTPAEGAGEEEIRACREANLRGMRELKKQTRAHLEYLMRKYGLGLTAMPVEELLAHKEEYANDALFSQTAENVLAVMERLQEEIPDADPPLYDEVDARLRNYQIYFMQAVHMFDDSMATMGQGVRTNYDDAMGLMMEYVTVSGLQGEGLQNDLKINWDLKRVTPENADQFAERIRGYSEEDIRGTLARQGMTEEEIDQMLEAGELRWDRIAGPSALPPVERLINAAEGTATQALKSRSGDPKGDGAAALLELCREVGIRWAGAARFEETLDRFRMERVRAQAQEQHPELVQRWQDFSERAGWFQMAFQAVRRMRAGGMPSEGRAEELVSRSLDQDLGRVAEHFRHQIEQFAGRDGAGLVQDSAGIF